MNGLVEPRRAAARQFARQSRQRDSWRICRTRRDGKLEHVATLNGTAVTARTVIALLENFQDEGGSISVPEVLWEYGAPRRLGGVESQA